MKGRHWTEEDKCLISELTKSAMANPSVKIKLRERANEPYRIERAIQNLPKNQKGQNHPLYGKHLSAETRAA